MSQRECAGFNWPPLAIPAEEPVSICPQAVNRAGAAIAAKSCRRCCTFEPSLRVIDKADSGLPVRSFWHDGVGHPLSTAAWFSVMFGVVNPCEGLLFESQAVGLGHPANCARSFRFAIP
ncbi:hypothetical protein AN928_32985 [Pseudomonas aeruginosa]|nr:hypothetical protein BHE76_29590 [Pseudomonas aeruginosa]KZM04237.1 hypothetical protein AN929_14905 [Pseudomonas aeruginosa]KZM05532.1 hypothetical protein AN928_32985 [Pseudomonas aeruginosa]KZM12163.1 hypothetical protein AN930_13940 [Pseudomonas aeruginosa]OFC14155.1 hypothetical protein AN470_17090 [Pseudomonas aeruginosa]